MQIIFQTRFSFIGNSGWQSEASSKPSILFEPKRLEKRFEYFEKITLQSLKDQSERDFSMVILSAHRLPDAYKTRLSDLCNDMLGEERCKIIFNGWGVAGRVFRRHVHNHFSNKPDTPIAQVVLDDDDAVSNDFVEVCRVESCNAASRPLPAENPWYISFPRGYSMLLDDEKPRLKLQLTPYVNLGLTQVSPAGSGRNPYLISHKRIGLRRPTRLIDDQKPYYLRAVHSYNDSKVNKDFEHEDVGVQSVVDRFPLLNNLY